MEDFILNYNQKKILKNISFLKKYDFYLAGGTALALYFGHRTSQDLDFYKKKYPEIFNEYNCLTALTYFKDAETGEQGRKRIYIYSGINWQTIKKNILKEVKNHQLALIKK